MRKQPHLLRRFAVTAAVALALCAGVSAQAASLVPLGRAVGIQMTTAGMLVADLAEVDTPGGKATPAKDAGLLPGDVICRIDGRNIASSADFLAAMDAAGDTMSVTVLRGGAEGGLLTPGLAVGGLVSLLLCALWQLGFPGGDKSSFALVGAAAFLAASMQMPLTAVVLVMEFTHMDHSYLAPALLCAAGAFLTCRALDKK